MSADSLTVLIVDDVKSSRRVIRRLLDKIGVTKIHEAECGEQAIAALTKESNIQLVITDFNLGTMNGVELINAFRQNSEFQTLPAIVISSDADRNKVLDAIKLGVSGFLLKPFDSATLKQKMEDALKRTL